MTPINLVFLQAHRPLTKTIRQDGTLPYPMTRAKTSHHRLVASIKEFHNCLQEHAAAGHCLYMGLLSEPLVNESRAGRTLATPRNWLVLDFDGLDYDIGPARPLTPQTVQNVAEHALKMLPEAFQQVSYIAHASASMGMRNDKASVHLFFLLDKLVPAAACKKFLQTLNLTTPSLIEQLSLTKTGWGLRYRLDPVVNDNARELFIAPPQFDGVADPFADPNDRIVLVKKSQDLLQGDTLLDSVDPTDRVTAEVRRLRKAAGMDTRKRASYREITMGSRDVRVLVNPEKGILTPAYESDGFCYYNLNGGDSRGYYHPKGRPDIIFNFKDEPPFRWVDLDPDGYRAYCKAHGDDIKEANPIQRFMVLDAKDGSVRRIEYNATVGTVEVWPDKETNKTAFYTQHGMFPPETLEYWTVEEDPRNPPGVDHGHRIINTARLGPLMYRPGIVPEAIASELQYGNARLIEQLCPLTWAVLHHAMANSDLETNHFINWLALIYQSRDKAGTGWVWQGVPGTGKGAFFHHTLSTIFGRDACTMLLADQVQEQFTGWRRGKLLVVIDEFEAKHMRGRSNVMDARLKNWVTEPFGQIRAMHQEQQQERLFDNFILYSNKHDVLVIEDGDRRWNVAPRQEVKLEQVIPDIARRLNSGELEQEAPLFAGTLASWTVDLAKAKRPLENLAKTEAKVAAESSLDEVVEALRSGNLNYFVPVLQSETTDTDEIMPLQIAKRAIREWTSSPQPVFATMEALHAVVRVCAGATIAKPVLGRTLTRKGLAGAKTDRYTRGRWLHFHTEHLDQESLDILNDTRNIVPLKGAM